MKITARKNPGRPPKTRPAAPVVKVRVVGDRRDLARCVGGTCARIWGNPALLAGAATKEQES